MFISTPLTSSRRYIIALVVSFGWISSIRADLVAHWKLDEGEGDVFEDSAEGNDGFLTDGMTIEWDDGPPTQDNAVRFLGADSFIATEFPGIGGNDPRTITFWLKTLDADAYMLGWGSTAAGRKWHIRLDGVSGVIRTEFATGQNFGGLPINDGEWHHVASVFPEGATEGSEVIHYIDGAIDPQAGGTSVPIDTAVGEGLAPWTDGSSGEAYYVHFGGVLAHGFGRMLDGSMADVRIYDEELSEEEIIDIMEGVDTGLPDNCPGGLRAERDGANVKLGWQPGGAETSVRVTRNGNELAAAASVDPPEFVDTTAPPGEHDYELTFDAAGCDPLSRTFRGCPTDLAASLSVGDDGSVGVELTWVNQFAYEGLEVRRGDDVIATAAGDAQSYRDRDPSGGLLTYSVVPTTGDCEAVTVDARVPDSRYAAMVIADGADGYWRLDDEDDVALVALNVGSAGSAIDGAYAGTVILENDSLLPASPENPSILLEGIDGSVTIPNHDTINVGGPFTSKTIELWFRADVIDAEPRLLYEQGGATRGLSIYVQDVAGDLLLFMCGWNLAQEQWGVLSVSVEIEPEVPYHAVMVFDASEDEDFGDFDGRITGYLDGEEFDTVIGADRLYEHTGAIAIGAANGAAVLADGSQPTGGFFTGVIDEFALYNIALDDPNDDKDLADSRVMAHYLAGIGTDDRPVFHRGDTGTDGTINIADAVGLLNFLFGGGADSTCKETQDFDNDGSIVITDAVSILSFLFSSGPPPAAPGPTTEPCGPDPDEPGSAGDLGCDAYDAC